MGTPILGHVQIEQVSYCTAVLCQSFLRANSPRQRCDGEVTCCSDFAMIIWAFGWMLAVEYLSKWRRWIWTAYHEASLVDVWLADWEFQI